MIPSMRKRSWSCARRYAFSASQAAPLERDAQLVEQLLELERLRDEALGAEPRHFDGFAHRAVARDHDGDDFRIAGEGFVEDLASVHAGQPEIGDQNVEGESFRRSSAASPRAGLLDPKAMLGQPFRDDLAKGRFVIDEQQVLDGDPCRGDDILTHRRRSELPLAGLIVLNRAADSFGDRIS